MKSVSEPVTLGVGIRVTVGWGERIVSPGVTVSHRYRNIYGAVQFCV